MAEAKTKPTDASVADFLDAAQPARRADDAKRAVVIIREETGAEPVMWGPSMVGFGSFDSVSPSGSPKGDWPKVALSPRKAALTLYGLKDHPEGEKLLPELGDYTEGAGCVYVKRLDGIDEDVLRRLVRIAWRREDDETRDA